MEPKFVLLNFLVILSYCYCQEVRHIHFFSNLAQIYPKFSNTIVFSNVISLNQPSFYTAAVVEAPMVDYEPATLISITKEMVDVINSPDVERADIIVLPEALFNNEFKSFDLPKSTVYCDDAQAHFLLRNISCAARNAKKYVVIDVYSKIKCADDDQPFCANQTDQSNVYNMALAFDRHGATIAK